jgi:hypothetical protein
MADMDTSDISDGVPLSRSEHSDLQKPPLRYNRFFSRRARNYNQSHHQYKYHPHRTGLSHFPLDEYSADSNSASRSLLLAVGSHFDMDVGPSNMRCGSVGFPLCLTTNPDCRSKTTANSSQDFS